MKRSFILLLAISALLLSACNKEMQNTQENETYSGSEQVTEASGTGDEALSVYMDFLSGNVFLLDDEELGKEWTDFYLPNGGMEYTLLELDGDGTEELLVRLVEDPSGLNAVFDYQYGRLVCRNFDSVEMSSRDYPLSDGTMVHQYDFNGTRSYTGFRYLPDGTTEELFNLFARDELINEDDTNSVPYYEIDGEEVDSAVFESELDKRITGQLLERSAWIAISYTDDSEESGDTAETASREDLQTFKDSFEYPSISMGENSSTEEIMLAGKRAGLFFSREVEKYFGYGAEYKWKVDGTDERSTAGNSVCVGPYTDKENRIYFPMSGNEAKWFLINQLRLTERGFEDLCLNSPSNYTLDGNDLIVFSGDGGQAGWDYSYIVDYEMEGNTVTYNCLRVGTKEEWGYEEDMTEPFTFRLAYEDGIWKLDGCSCGEGLFYWFIGLKSDADAYPESAQTEQPYSILDLDSLNPDFENLSGGVTFFNGDVFCVTYDVTGGEGTSKTELCFYNIKEGTFLKSVPFPDGWSFSEYLGGGYGDVLCKVRMYSGTYKGKEFLINYSVLTVYNDYTYEISDDTVQNSAVELSGHMISRWELDLVCVDGEPEIIVPGSYREDDEYGFDTKFQFYRFPIDENRFVYRTGGYESMPGFGVYDFDTKTAMDVPDSRDLFPIGIHDGKLYSEKTAWDGYGGSEIYVTDLETLETSFFTEFPYYLRPSDSIQYFMPENGEYIIALKEGSADFIYRTDPDTGETEYICQLPEDFYFSGGADFIDENTFVISSGSKLLILTVPD